MLLKETAEKNIVKTIHLMLFRPLPPEYRVEFEKLRFSKNNFRTFIVSLFLFFEQLFYGFFISNHGSPQQFIFFFSAVFMVAFISFSFYFEKRRPFKTGIIHQAYAVSLAWFGMIIALRRFIIIDFTEFYLPTVYIAVIYGIAVVFYMKFIQSILFYLLFAVMTILMIRVAHPSITNPVYIADICSNAFIAWMISYINYSNFVKDFRNQKTIEEKNRILLENNRHIAYMNDKLQELSVRDPLTGLFNRRKLDDILKREFEKSTRYGSDFSVIILDLDFFKQINDSYGHDRGDEVLKQIAEILSMNTRSTDECGRWGGEEFMLICSGIDLLETTKFAERLRSRIGLLTFDENGAVTASFGIATIRESGDIGRLLKLADQRLYSAKKNGRNRVGNGIIF
ncbi:MAG TPA: diguanylate cyclase [Spirochaetota bacterium]|nr:diguanylate cyclase [Spirochaetota bacterium]HPJ36659.1 diguanylate cyclase [Spirochaetota bacterium]